MHDTGPNPTPRQTGNGLRLYTTGEVASMLGVTRQHVSLVARETGIGRKPGRDWQFTADDVAALRARPDRRQRDRGRRS